MLLVLIEVIFILIMKSKNGVIDNPYVVLFTTLMLSGVIFYSSMDDFYKSQYNDEFVRWVYRIVALYIFAKKIFDLWRFRKSSS